MVRLGLNFNNFVDEIFKEHHDSLGLCEEEIADLIEDSEPEQRLKWVKKHYNIHDEWREYND